MAKRLSLEQLRPEMVLSADIVDAAGRLLLPAGTALSEKHLRYCQMWGIDGAMVGDGDGPIEEASVVDPARLAEAAAQLEPRFRHVDRGHPVIDAVHQHAVQMLLAKRT